MTMDTLLLSLIILGLGYSVFYIREHKEYISQKIKELLNR